MRTGFIPWTDVVLAQVQPYQRVAWFVFESIEREHRLNLDALSAYWLRALTPWPNPRPLPGDGPSAMPHEHTRSSPVHAATRGGSNP